MVHLPGRSHNARFIALMYHYMPEWKQLKSELKKLRYVMSIESIIITDKLTRTICSSQT